MTLTIFIIVILVAWLGASILINMEYYPEYRKSYEKLLTFSKSVEFPTHVCFEKKGNKNIDEVISFFTTHSIFGLKSVGLCNGSYIFASLYSILDFYSMYWLIKYNNFLKKNN